MSEPQIRYGFNHPLKGWREYNTLKYARELAKDAADTYEEDSITIYRVTREVSEVVKREYGR